MLNIIIWACLFALVVNVSSCQPLLMQTLIASVHSLCISYTVDLGKVLFLVLFWDIAVSWEVISVLVG